MPEPTAPTAGDTPTAAAAASLVIPVATCFQNSRSTSRRCDGAPGDFISDRPVNSFIHPAGLPINNLLIKVLRPPIESIQYMSVDYRKQVTGYGMIQSVGRTGVCWDNSVAESAWSSLKRELVHRYRFSTRAEARRAIFAWINRYNSRRRHSTLGYIAPIHLGTAIHNQPTANPAA